MNDHKTFSMLQRVPVILAVTAASYGLQVPPQALRLGTVATTTAHADAGRAAPPLRSVQGARPTA